MADAQPDPTTDEDPQLLQVVDATALADLDVDPQLLQVVKALDAKLTYHGLAPAVNPSTTGVVLVQLSIEDAERLAGLVLVPREQTERAEGMQDRHRLKLLDDMERLVRGMRPVSTGMLAGRSARRRSARATSTIRANAPGGGSGGTPGGGGHSDPTLGAVESPTERAAKVERELVQWDEQLLEVANLLANLAAKIARAQRTPKEERPPEQKPLVGCRSCSRLNGWFNEVAVGQYSDLCRRCGDFKGTEKRLPPLGLIELLRQGKPWTASAIEKAMRAEANRSDRALLKASR